MFTSYGFKLYFKMKCILPSVQVKPTPLDLIHLTFSWLLALKETFFFH